MIWDAANYWNTPGVDAVRIFMEDAGYVLGFAVGAVALAALAHGLIALLRRPFGRLRSRPGRSDGALHRGEAAHRPASARRPT